MSTSSDSTFLLEAGTFDLGDISTDLCGRREPKLIVNKNTGLRYSRNESF